MKNFLYQSFSKVHGDEIAWRIGSNRLRILCYHGVCEDRLAAEPWMPQYFVSRAAFESQLRYLSEHANVVALREGLARLQDGSLPPRSVSLTFDDGYANNLEVAYPLLRQYQIPFFIFLSTAYIESGELHPFLKLRLIQLSAHRVGLDLTRDPLPDYKTMPLDQVEERADRWWARLKTMLTNDQSQTLRPMSIEEVTIADTKLIEFGPHCHTHCILRNESPERRRKEIRTSIQKIAQWTGRPVKVFSYPNGEAGDFGEVDKQTLRGEGIEAAVTGIAGANGRDIDPLELRRYPLTMNHDESRFRAEVSGFRRALQSVSERLSV